MEEQEGGVGVFGWAGAELLLRAKMYDMTSKMEHVDCNIKRLYKREQNEDSIPCSRPFYFVANNPDDFDIYYVARWRFTTTMT